MATLDFTKWPIVPTELRPKRLYYCGELDTEQAEALVKGGWDPIDVRLMPTTTEPEKAASIKGWLEGVRLGSIQASAGQVKFVELEARIFGMLQARGHITESKTLDKEDLDDILNFGKEKVEWQAMINDPKKGSS